MMALCAALVLAMLVCALASGDALTTSVKFQSVKRTWPNQPDPSVVRELQKIWKNPFKPTGLDTRPSQDTRSNQNSVCSCQGYTCGCCLRLDVRRISLNETGCVNITYLPSELGLELTMTLNGVVLIDDKISVKNPPPICAAIPYIHDLASLCVKFRDLDVKDRQLSGCVSIELELAGKVVENFDLGCFHIPPNTINRSEGVVAMSIIERAPRKALAPTGNRLTFLYGDKARQNSVCSCQGYTCSCCLHLDVAQISLHETGCVNMTYLPSELGLELTLTLDGFVIIDDKISVKNPPPICAAIPYIHDLASLCIKFRDLDVKDRQLSGCVSIEVESAGMVVGNFDLGCFHIPPKAVKVNSLG